MINIILNRMQKSGGCDWRNFPVFLPISRISILWQFFVLIYIIVDFVITVMAQCYESYYNIQDLLHNYFDRILILVMALDILVSFNTVVIKNGIILDKRQQIASHYLRSTYFWIDLLCFLVSIIQVALNSRTSYSTAYNFIVFIKVIKVYEFDKNIKRYALKSFDALLFYEIIKNIVFLSLICYTLGAFIYLIDYNLLQSNTYPTTGPNPNPYWITTSSSLPNIIDRDLWVKISYSYYFIIVLLSGVAYGDLVPQNPVETLYITLLMLFPLVIYSYVFNAVYNIISKKRERAKLIRKYQLVTKRYLQNLRVKKSLQTKLITYLTYIFKKTAQDYQFIDSLAPSIKKQYLTHNIRAKFDFLVFEQLLAVAPRVNHNKFEDALIDIIKEQTFPQRYKLIMPPLRFKLYYINQGICKRVAAESPAKYSDKFVRNQYICYYPFLTGTCTSKLTYQSASFVVAQTVDRFAFIELLKQRDFEQLKQAFYLMKDEQILYHNETVNGQLCFFCNSPTHMFENCYHMRPKIRYDKTSRKSQHKRYVKIYGEKQTAYLRKKIRGKKVRLERSPLYQREPQRERYCEAEVQCNQQQIESGQLKQQIQLDAAVAYSVYYNEYNIMT